MRIMYDASTPPANPPKTDAVAYYIGGDTPHVWTDAEIKAQTARYRAPIWVRSNPQGATQGTEEAHKVVAIIEAHKQPKNTVVFLDFETAEDSAYVEAFDTVLVAAGYETSLYGSTSTLFKNHKPSGGYWAAEPGTSATLPANLAAKQYAFRQAYDLSVVSDSLKLWDVRGGIPVPLPVTHSVAINLPTVKQGDSGDYVRTVQALANVRGASPTLTVDGAFGPKTATGVAQVQARLGLPTAAIVDEPTWEALITNANVKG